MKIISIGPNRLNWLPRLLIGVAAELGYAVAAPLAPVLICPWLKIGIEKQRRLVAPGSDGLSRRTDFVS